MNIVDNAEVAIDVGDVGIGPSRGGECLEYIIRSNLFIDSK